MFSITRRYSAVILTLAAGLLAGAAPAHAGIAIGNPPQSGPGVVSPRDAASGLPTGVVAHGGDRPAALLDADMEI